MRLLSWSGGAAEIEFTSIPATYQHLQIRMITRTTLSAYFEAVLVYLNGDTASNYAEHLLYGDGSSALAAGAGSTTFNFVYASGASAGSSIFSATVLNILDYASTTKATTFRTMFGWDNNGNGSTFGNTDIYIPNYAGSTAKSLSATMASEDNGSEPRLGAAAGLWTGTSAITSVKLFPYVGSDWKSGSSFYLYGIKKA